MPKSCVAFQCHNHNLNGKQVSFHVFPSNIERRRQWIRAVNRAKQDNSLWSPTKHAVICGEHFIQGKPHKDPNHPDHVPSIFAHLPHSTKEKGKQRVKRHERVSAARRSLFQPQDVADTETPTLEMEPVPLSSVQDVETEPLSSSPVKKRPRGMNTPLETSERGNLYDEMNNLREERDRELSRADCLQDKLTRVRLTALCVQDDDKKCHFYTGLTWDIFHETFEYLSPFMTSRNKCSLPFLDQFFITLVRLRLDLPFQLIAYQTSIGKSTVIDVFWRWIDLMHAKLGFLIKWPDRDAIYTTLPPVFKQKFPRLTCIIDCFEIFVDQPKNLKARAQIYSHYKKHTTVKVLIGCTPQGAVSFLSRAWGGRVSDIHIVRESGLLDPNLHIPGDQILADRGFTLQEDFATKCSVELIIPSFTKGKKQLSAHEVENSRKISSVRIHIERIIGLVKNRFRILQGTLPIQIIKSIKDEAQDVQLASIDKILIVCHALANMGDGIVYSE